MGEDRGRGWRGVLGCTCRALSTTNAVLLAPAGMVHGAQARWPQWPTTVSVVWAWPTTPALEVGAGLGHPVCGEGPAGGIFSHPASACHFPPWLRLAMWLFLRGFSTTQS